MWTCYVLKGHFAKRSGQRRNAVSSRGKSYSWWSWRSYFLIPSKNKPWPLILFVLQTLWSFCMRWVFVNLYCPFLFIFCLDFSFVYFLCHLWFFFNWILLPFFFFNWLIKNVLEQEHMELEKRYRELTDLLVTWAQNCSPLIWLLYDITNPILFWVFLCLNFIYYSVLQTNTVRSHG